MFYHEKDVQDRVGPEAVGGLTFSISSFCMHQEELPTPFWYISE